MLIEVGQPVYEGVGNADCLRACRSGIMNLFCTCIVAEILGVTWMCSWGCSLDMTMVIFPIR